MKKNFDNKKKYLSLHHSKITDISNDGDLVAQLVEQYTFNVWVLGSNPSQVTFKEKIVIFFILIFCDLVFKKPLDFSEGFLFGLIFCIFVEKRKEYGKNTDYRS